ncbi:MAG: chemotaxis protein CheW [Pseudomonadota bacterium]
MSPSVEPKGAGGPAGQAATQDFVTMTVADQLFGLPVLTVRDALGPQRITRIPLAPPEIAGALNLRGRIVTVIDVRKCLDLPPRPAGNAGMSLVVDHKGELYSLVIDAVGEVLSVAADTFERSPATLNPRWRDVAGGIYRLEGRLLVVLEVARLLDVRRVEAA